ncbi:MAG: ParB/RepB/Spo0J family partition protein [Planctomycetia bacterium]|nr:ParB/RepB/Spo0J family partition protein [Planctomycetia bacterium]
MAIQHATKGALIPIDYLQVPEGYHVKPRKVDDEILFNSIQLTGVQQPIIVVRLADSSYLVVDGVRRLTLARALGLSEVPCVIDQGIDDVDDEVEYRNRVRFILDEHRQDLLPTQRAALIKRLQQSFDMTGRQVALYLGVTAATITNWLHIDNMIPEIRHAVDEDRITIHTTRAFAAMTEAGQTEIWKNHADAVLKMSASRLHRWVRETYPPAKFPHMYESPEAVIRQLTRKSTPRKAQKRTKVSVDEKKTLLKDVDAKKIELQDKQAQVAEYTSHIEAAIPVIEAFRENAELWDSLPAAVRSDFEEFANRYLPAVV